MFVRENKLADASGITFSMPEEHLGETIIVQLKPGGLDIPVTEENKHEYVDLVVNYHLKGKIQAQYDALLKGFHELIPPKLTGVFKGDELEMLLCGVPNIKVSVGITQRIFCPSIHSQTQ